MKPNQEQQNFIKAQLQSITYVQETYEELYDHVLTALEGVPDDAPFFDAVNNIIENDLGGAKAIKSIEAKYLKIAIKEYIFDYFRCLGQCLTSYFMLIIIAATVGYYLLMQYEWFNAVIGQVITSFIILIPAAIVGRKTVNTIANAPVKTLIMDYAKTTIRPFGNIFMLFFPMLLWTNVSLVCMKLQRAKLIPNQIDYNGMPVNVASVLFFIILIHAVAYHKLYKDWHKTLMASYL
ncbi:hypothetical protein [Mucilaginibacter sp. UYCu711]|uniref:hypothetical protein n=1 Tax=Mucilaginibacter sp. UYCu711 TaxID=3156339 RepID=UPI003D2495FC